MLISRQCRIVHYQREQRRRLRFIRGGIGVTAERDGEVSDVYVVPGNYYRIEVPNRILDDPVAFEAYVAALLAEQRKTAWHQQTVPAWLFVMIVGALLVIVLASDVVPLGLR